MRRWTGTAPRGKLAAVAASLNPAGTMITLITLFALSTIASSQGWTEAQQAPQAIGVSPVVWALDTGQGPRWTISPNGELRWSGANASTRDSLALSWATDVTGANQTLDLSVVMNGPSGFLSCEFALVLPDGRRELLRAPGTPGADSGDWQTLRLSSPAQITTHVPLRDGSSRVVMSVSAHAGQSAKASLHVRSLAVRGDRGTVSLVPTPTACGDHGPADGVAGAWYLPRLAEGRWWMEIPEVTMPTPWIVEVSCPLSTVAERMPPRVLWKECAAGGQWQAAEARWTHGQSDTLVAVIDPIVVPDERASISLDLDVGEGGGAVGPIMVGGRPRAPFANELALAQVMCAPAESEFLEVLNRLRWRLPLSPLSIEVDGRSCNCGEGSIPPEGSVIIRRGDCPGLVLPNDCAEIRLLWEDREIDRLSFGPEHPAPAPPYGWSLRRDSLYTLDRAPIPGWRVRPSTESAAADSVVLSEISLWPLDSPDRFIEIVNRGSAAVHLAGWAVLCEGALVLTDTTAVAPGAMLTIPADSFPSSFALNPDAGDLTLVDPSGRIIDRVRWTAPPPPDHSLCRAATVSLAGQEWVANPPTPGRPGQSALGPIDIEITVTAEGRCIQWHYPLADHPSFWVYRAPALQSPQRSRVTTVPIVGAPPHSFVDIDAAPGENLLYWLGIVMASGQEVLVGPVLSPARDEALELSIGPPTPNPFRTDTSVPYSIVGLGKELASIPDGSAGHRMHLGVYTMGGRLVRTLAADRLQDGASQVFWDGRDDASRLCPPGVYVFSLQVGQSLRSVRVVFAGQ